MVWLGWVGVGAVGVVSESETEEVQRETGKRIRGLERVWEEHLQSTGSC